VYFCGAVDPRMYGVTSLFAISVNQDPFHHWLNVSKALAGSISISFCERL